MNIKYWESKLKEALKYKYAYIYYALHQMLFKSTMCFQETPKSKWIFFKNCTDSVSLMTTIEENLKTDGIRPKLPLCSI
jgi:hypothetical protein